MSNSVCSSKVARSTTLSRPPESMSRASGVLLRRRRRAFFSVRSSAVATGVVVEVVMVGPHATGTPSRARGPRVTRGAGSDAQRVGATVVGRGLVATVVRRGLLLATVVGRGLVAVVRRGLFLF